MPDMLLFPLTKITLSSMSSPSGQKRFPDSPAKGNQGINLLRTSRSLFFNQAVNGIELWTTTILGVMRLSVFSTKNTINGSLRTP
jgi:hypothetical protein